MTDSADHRLSLHWRSSSHRQEMTEQEKVLAQWLTDQEIPFKYEQLQLIKNNDLAGQEVIHGHKVRKADVLRTVPDFIFTSESGEIFIIEVTERKRPSRDRPNRQKVDPKRRTRHLARLAGIDCAVIYRGEMDKFFELFKHENPNIQNTSHVKLLQKTIKEWLKVEWNENL